MNGWMSHEVRRSVSRDHTQQDLPRYSSRWLELHIAISYIFFKHHCEAIDAVASLFLCTFAVLPTIEAKHSGTVAHAAKIEQCKTFFIYGDVERQDPLI